MIHAINVPSDFMSSRTPSSDSKKKTSTSTIKSANGDMFPSTRRGKMGKEISVESQLPPNSPRAPNMMWSDLFARRIVNRMQAERDRQSATEEVMKGMDNVDSGKFERQTSMGLTSPDSEAPPSAIRFAHSLPRSSQDRKESSSLEKKIVEPIHVHWIDLNIVLNTHAHRTSDFDMTRGQLRHGHNPQLVIRRAQAFKIDMAFYRNVNVANDSFEIIWAMTNGHESEGTRVVLPLPLNTSTNSTFAGWTVHSVRTAGDRMSIEMSTFEHCAVGEWNVVLRAIGTDENGERTDTDTPLPPVIVLFNPWVEADPTYMPCSTDLTEYVANECGTIMRGSHNAVQPTFWSFGMYDKDILQIALLVLERCNLNKSKRGNVADVVREIAAFIQCKSDDGIITLGDTSSNLWTGSTAILREWAKFGEPIGGTSWVTAGVLTTVLRALGIPTRIVTNFNSATNDAVHVRMNAENGKITHNSDNTKMYKVWNNVWIMSPEGQGQWHAVDATRENTHPVPLADIQKGEPTNRDTSPFVIALNAPKCYWLDSVYDYTRLNRVDYKSTGTSVITKSPENQTGEDPEEVQDITQGYKSGTLCRLPDHLKPYLRLPTTEPIFFKVNLTDRSYLGETFTTTVSLENTSNVKKTASLIVRMSSCTLDCTPVQKLKTVEKKVAVKPGETKEIDANLLVRDYTHSESSTFLISVFGRVEGTDQVFTHTDNVQLRLPTIDVQGAEGARLLEGKQSKNKRRSSGCKMM